MYTTSFGHGFLESVYEQAMTIALTQAALGVERQIPLQVMCRGEIVGDFRADVLVERAVLLELKAGRDLDPAHEAQLLNYLRATKIEVGLLLNFGPTAKIQTPGLRQFQQADPCSSASIRG
jgi:GxxExxY protein